MKIAIIAAHFMPEIGYQEVYLARAYAKSGHEVKIFTSTKISPTSVKVLKNEYPTGEYLDDKYKFRILRLKSSFNFRSIVICKGLLKSVRDFEPDILILLGIAKLFPISLLKVKLDCKYISIYGDSKEYRNRSNSIERVKSFFLDLGFKIIKKRYYKRSVQLSDLLILNIPETENIFNSILGYTLLRKFAKIKYNLNLGYDTDEFFFDLQSRRRIRKNLNLQDDDVLITSITKVTRIKNIGEIIRIIINLIKAGYNTHYMLIGLLNDEYEKELRNQIFESGYSNNFHLFGFKNHAETRDYFCASDIGIWTKAAISIQEAMGTGLKVLIPDRDSVSHLLKHNSAGWFFQENELETQLGRIMKCRNNDINNIGSRVINARNNAAYLSYDYISDNIITILNEKA